MFTIFLVLITIVCFLLIVVIMVQNPKGGGLSSAIAGPNQMGGVQKTTDFLDKSTWTLAMILVALIVFSSLSFNNGDGQSKIMNTNSETAAPAPIKPATPAPATPATPAPAETPAK